MQSLCGQNSFDWVLFTHYSSALISVFLMKYFFSPAKVTFFRAHMFNFLLETVDQKIRNVPFHLGCKCLEVHDWRKKQLAISTVNDVACEYLCTPLTGGRYGFYHEVNDHLVDDRWQVQVVMEVRTRQAYVKRERDCICRGCNSSHTLGTRNILNILWAGKNCWGLLCQNK